VKRLQAHNVWIMSMGERRFRAVTHYWIKAEHIDVALNAIREELS